MSIPKKIHYIWVGEKEKPKDIKRCMETWKKHLKDYEIIEWNEKNFDINAHPYAKKAYAEKKWAYVSDYIRLFVLYKYGGIYLDTDVIALDNFDEFLHERFFIGFENSSCISAAIFACEKEHPFIKILMDYYDNKEFEFDINSQFKGVNTKVFTDILVKKYELLLNNTKQKLDDGITVYKDDVFCNPSKNSVSVHIFLGSWIEGKKAYKRKLVKFLKLRIKTKAMAERYNKLIRKKN